MFCMFFFKKNKNKSLFTLGVMKNLNFFLFCIKTFDDYDTNELLLLSDTIKQSCF